jgi:predicted aspartyl protease
MRYRNIGLTAAATALAALVTMGATECQAPAQAPADEPAAGRSRSGEVSVPLKVINRLGGTVVLVPVRVNGRGPFDFILDTGASSSTISESLSRRLDLPDTGETAHISGVAGDTVAPIVTVRRWTLGGQRLHGRDLPALDLDSDPGAGPVNGLLGSDERRRFGVVRLDYKNRRLVLRARRAPTGAGRDAR